MYTIRLLQLSGSSVTELELPPAASISELLFEDRPLQMQETLATLGLPDPPFQVDLQLLHLQQPRLVERIDMQTSDFQHVDIGICGQRRAGKTSFLNQYADNRFHAEQFANVIAVDFRVANLRVEKERLRLDEIQEMVDLSASEPVSERVLVGNKVDVAAPGNTEEAEAFATANGLTYFEASAKDHESVEAVLRHTLLSVMDKLELNLTPFRRDRILAPEAPPERWRCALQ
eukprot:s19_g9.t2